MDIQLLSDFMMIQDKHQLDDREFIRNLFFYIQESIGDELLNEENRIKIIKTIINENLATFHLCLRKIFEKDTHLS